MTLSERYIGLVHNIAALYGKQGSDHYDELIGDGMVGLVQAERRYDPERGVPFHNYAARRIHGAMIDGMRLRFGDGRRATQLKTVALDGFDCADVRPAPGDLIGEDEAARVLLERVTEIATDRELNVMLSIAAGQRPVDVARRDGVSEAAIAHRRLRLRRKAEAAMPTWMAA